MKQHPPTALGYKTLFCLAVVLKFSATIVGFVNKYII